jgi:hypothetical protein
LPRLDVVAVLPLPLQVADVARPWSATVVVARVARPVAALSLAAAVADAAAVLRSVVVVPSWVEAARLAS